MDGRSTFQHTYASSRIIIPLYVSENMRDQRILCVYGTVTGKAESIAQQIALTAECKGVQVGCYDKNTE